MLSHERNYGQHVLGSMAEMLDVLALEYGPSVQDLNKLPHQWLIIDDAQSGLKGGMCLTPGGHTVKDPLLSSVCSQNEKGWFSSHLFCWLPEHISENSPLESALVVRFYQQLYKKLMDFCFVSDIHHLWTLYEIRQHQATTAKGLFPFDKEIPFEYQAINYVAGLLIFDKKSFENFRKHHIYYLETLHYNN